jgi:competence ComEA-like helix-hairpin-helix protein
VSSRVDVNRASREELLALPGVGDVLAERIIAHRERTGGFGSLEELRDVAGVSDRVFADLKPLVTTAAAAGEPEPSTLAVTLEPPNGPSDYTGHLVTVEGMRLKDEVGVPFSASAPVDAAGKGTVNLPARATIAGDVTLRVLSPDGALLLTTDREGATLPAALTLKVASSTYGETLPNDDPAAGKPTRVRGQVIDKNGKRSTAGLQVVLWGATVANPKPKDFRALVVVTTDGNGHFSAPYPLGDFTEVFATVAVGAEPETVPIHLEGKAFPESVILPVDMPDPIGLGDEDCACHDETQPPRDPGAQDLARADGTFSSDPGGGRCVDFTKPDRTLEEFSYTFLVRTTEPVIRGLTLDDPAKVDVRKILEVAQPSKFLASASFRAAALDVGEPEAEAAAGGGEPATAAAAGRVLEGAQIDAKVLRTIARDPDGFSLTSLLTADQITRHGDLVRLLGTAIKQPPGRSRLSCSSPVDWDDDPTIYQACTIANGHLLRFKQEWIADGYSMGSLLYSLPLAPGQKKQIAVVDWERRESAARTESVDFSEQLNALLERDRDISEIVSGTIRESTRGGSSASSGSIAGGLGVGAIFGPVGAVLGIGGGHSSADSSAWQESSRSTAANALNQLRDRTSQSASSVRSLRSSVVQTVTQGERVVATTETVANYNHCHAITVQYFEVLRHLLVRQRLVDVQECLFVPLLMSWFTSAKALRWRNTLLSATPAQFRGGYAALDRIAANYVGSDLPLGRYADEQLQTIDGDLRIRFQLTRPRDKDDQFDPNNWSPLLKLFGFDPQDFYNQFLKDQQFKDRVFIEQLGPKIASSVVDLMRIQALKTDDTLVDLKVDTTLLTRFANDSSLYVSLRMGGNLPPVMRSEIKALIISARLELPGLPFVIDVLPGGSRVIVESGSLRYTTPHLADALFRDTFIQNDLTGYDDVRISTPLNRQELRNPREEDKELARNLLDHLNENIERYHHVIWARMSPDRRYMLLDGFEAPNSGGRSVASVVENELIGIVGNCLVMPVAQGFHLDPTYKQDVENPIDLFEHYQPNTPIEPSRVAIPTRGVYCEAVMGACNSCEVKDETRFWRWEESPIPDQPPAILPTSTDTRRAEPPDLTAKDLPPAIVAMQSAPAAPDPTGLGALLGLLGQSGIFKDITGLEGTQRNAAAALQEAFETATTFGTKAADLALQGKMSKDIDKAMRTIQTAKSQGLINDEQAKNLTDAAIRGMIGAGTTNPPKATTTDEVKELTDTAGKNNAAVSVTRPTGEKVDVDATKALITPASFTTGAPSQGAKKLPTRAGTDAVQAWEAAAPIAGRDPKACPTGLKNLGTILFVHDAETKIDLRGYGQYTDANAWMLVHTVTDLIEGLRAYVGNCGYVTGIQIDAHGGYSGSGGFRLGDDTDGDGHVEQNEALDMVSTAAQAAKFGAIIKNALASGSFISVSACESSGTSDAFLKALNTATGMTTIGAPKSVRTGGNWFSKAWWEAEAGRTQVNADGSTKSDAHDEGSGIWRPF